MIIGVAGFGGIHIEAWNFTYECTTRGLDISSFTHTILSTHIGSFIHTFGSS